MTPHPRTSPSSRDLCREPLVDDAAVEERLRVLLAVPGEPPLHTVLWLMLIGPDDRQLPMLIPVDPAPDHPDAALTKGLERNLLALCAEGITEGSSVVFTLERPGGDRVRPSDAAWFRALNAMGETGVAVRGVYLLTGATVRPLTLDDAA